MPKTVLLQIIEALILVNNCSVFTPLLWLLTELLFVPITCSKANLEKKQFAQLFCLECCIFEGKKYHIREEI